MEPGEILYPLRIEVGEPKLGSQTVKRLRHVDTSRLFPADHLMGVVSRGMPPRGWALASSPTGSTTS